jgi:hypothetical protein
MQQFAVAGSQSGSGSGGALASQLPASQVVIAGVLASQLGPLQFGTAQPPGGQASSIVATSLGAGGLSAQLSGRQPGSQRSGLQIGGGGGAVTGVRQSAVSHCKPMTPGLWHAASRPASSRNWRMLLKVSREKSLEARAQRALGIAFDEALGLLACSGSFAAACERDGVEALTFFTQ